MGKVKNASLQQNIISFSLDDAVCDVGDREVASMASMATELDEQAEESLSIAVPAGPGSMMGGAEDFKANLENEMMATDVMMEEITAHMSTPGGDGREAHVLSYDE